MILSILKPFTVGIAIDFVAIIVLLFFSGMFASSEVAFFSLGPAQLEEIKNNLQRKSNSIINNLLARPKRLLATLLIANSLVNIAIIIISAFTVSQLFDFSLHPRLGFIIQVIVITFMIVLLGEVMPKVYATQKALPMAQTVAFPLYALDKLLSPLSYVLVSLTHVIERRLTKKGYDITIDELTHAIDITSDQTTPADEKKILKGIVKFGNIDVKQIMKARIDVVSLEKKFPFTRVLKSVEEAGYSRLPVYEETFDKVIGILYIKDLIAHLDKEDAFKWTTLIRPPYFIPESKKINDLLDEFQEKKMHMAIVIDEYGSATGIVSLEDILEEIVGEISDEFDDEEPVYSKLDENNFVFEAKTLLNDVCRVMEIERSLFDEITGETDTLAGLVLELAGKIPVKGEKINFKDFKFTIESADRRKIKRVKITKEIHKKEEV
ncbi:MAG TPA: gliding motility-associated protein GldE [Bacteroidia bacterium]|nr:gliding motility-associated protein GldE [Bacteroidia bacterium]